MGLFTGIGDFFRGAFGEDEEEKRRRKERERQAAQARVQKKPQQAPQPNPPKTNFQQQSIQNKQKPFSQVNKVAETATKTYQEQQNPSKARKELDELKNKHLARALEEEKNRTSWFDRQFTNRNWDKTAEATAMRRATAEYQDKYGWTKDPEVLDYLNQSKNKLDEAQKNGVSQWIAPVLSTGRVGTGMVQGGAGLYDLVTPGKGTNRVSQASTKKAEEIDQLAKDLGVNNLYKTTNVIGEVASYLIPGTAAAKVASKFPKGTKLTADVIEKIASKVDNADDANKVRQFLANQMRRNFTLDEALQETAITGRYMGQNTAQGGDTSPLSVTTDILTGFAGGILVPTKLKKGKNTLKDTEADEAVGATIATGSEYIDNALTNNVADIDLTKSVRDMTNEELQAITQDSEMPAYQRQQYKDELARRNNVQDQANNPNKSAYDEQRSKERGEGNILREVQDVGGNPGDVNDIPAYARKDPDGDIRRAQDEIDNIDEQLSMAPEKTIEEYKFTQKQKLADDIRANPSKKDQLIALYNKRVEAANNLKNLDKYRAGLELRKAELQRVIDNANLVKQKLDEAAAASAKQTDETLKAQQATNAAVEAEQAAAQEPAPAGASNAPNDTNPETPEGAANNAYNPADNTFSGITYTNDTDAMMDELMQKLGYNLDRDQRANVWSKLWGIIPRTTQRITDPLSDLANKGITKAVQSKNPLTSRLAQAPRNVWSRFGMGDAARSSLDKTAGLTNTAREVGLRISRRRNETIKQLLKDGYSKEDLVKVFHQVFETPDFLRRLYGEDLPNLKPDQLPPQLKSIVDEQIELNKLRNYINFKTGIIDEGTYFQGIDGMHTPRVYGFEFSKSNKAKASGGSLFDATAGMSREELDKVPDEIFKTVIDPLTAQDIRFQQALVNKARLDSTKLVKEQFGAFDRPPNSGYVQLNGKQYGELDGKYVDLTAATALQRSPIFKTQLGTKLNDILDIWRDSPFGAADRFVKQTKTIGSVGTNVGNIGSNITLFSTGAGVDPAFALFRGIGGARSLIKDARGGMDPDIYYLRKEGIIGSDTGRAINGVPPKELIKVESLLTEAENLSRKNPNAAIKLFSKAWSSLQDFYGGTDDAFKVGIYRELKARGYDDATALRRVREQFQNYANVGRGVQTLADSPVMGKPFARFIPELGRITKNSLKNNPVGMAAGLGAMAYAGDKLSEMAGETPEDRANREDTIGQTRIPFTGAINKSGTDAGKDLSLNFALPNDSSINVARAMGFNFPMDAKADPNKAMAEQMSPVAIPVRQDAGGNTVFAPEEVVTSMSLNPLARMFVNRDFMGRRITDPDNKVRWEGKGGESRYKYETADGKPMDDSKNSNYNRAKTAVMSYLPFASEVDAVTSGIMGKEDYYGKERTPGQAIARMFGLKVEKNDQKAREDRAEMNQYYENQLPEVQKFLRDNPTLVDSYWAIKNNARDRYTDVATNDIVSPEKFKIIAADKSGKLFDFFKQQAINTSKKENKPLDPLYTLPPDQANQVVQLKAMNTGDDMKFQQLLYKENWFKGYKEADRKYQNSKPEYEPKPGQAKQNPRPEEWYALSEDLYSDEGVKSRYPLVKQYQDAIDKFANYDSDERREFTKNWYAKYGDAYKEEKANYEAERLAIVNKMRGIEGAPPMSPEVWSGQFETDEDRASGYGYGYGGGGGGSDIYKPLEINNITGLTNYSADVNGFQNSIQEMPQLAQFFKKLQASGGGGRQKPKIGASSSGQ